MPKIIKKLINCPYLQRIRKADERLFRAITDGVEVSDLPTGPRHRWVNDLTRGLVRIMKSDDPVHEWEESVCRFLHAAMRGMMRMDRKYQKIRREMGLDW